MREKQSFKKVQGRYNGPKLETEMLAFSRRSGESINALLARYEIVRQRAPTEGQFVMSIEGCALQILRACNVQPG